MAAGSVLHLLDFLLELLDPVCGQQIVDWKRDQL